MPAPPPGAAESAPSTSRRAPRRARARQDDAGAEVLAALQSVQEAAKPFNDADLAFGQCLGLELKKLPEASKLETKLKLWQVLLEAQRLT